MSATYSVCELRASRTLAICCDCSRRARPLRLPRCTGRAGPSKGHWRAGAVRLCVAARFRQRHSLFQCGAFQTVDLVCAFDRIINPTETRGRLR
jgi:hypothetical protein